VLLDKGSIFTRMIARFFLLLAIFFTIAVSVPGHVHAEDVPAPNPAAPESQDDVATPEPEGEEFDDGRLENPTVLKDLSLLPFPTRRMHELILEATKSGDIEKLRPLIGIGDSATQLSLGGFDGDAIDFLRKQSGDPQGQEILAILEEVLEAGFVHLDKGTDHELFVWPYFFAYSLDQLNDRQMVELFRIVTFGDYQDMQDFGGYIFYRVGISPTGRWHFFVAGD